MPHTTGVRGVGELLDQEIKWHEDCDDSGVTKDYRDGFIKGLKQAKLLVEKLNESNE